MISFCDFVSNYDCGRIILLIRVPFHFAEKECTCNNGDPSTGADCPKEGGEKCASCNEGYIKDEPTNKCARTYIHRANRSPPKNASHTHNAKSRVSCVCLCCCCAAKMCTCTNGVAPRGLECAEDGQLKCTKCNGGYHMDKEKTMCIINMCKCDDGVPQSGLDCPVIGKVSCRSCNTGWTINNEKTKCNSACAHSDALCTDRRISPRAIFLRLTQTFVRVCAYVYVF